MTERQLRSRLLLKRF